jgi:hypothetical protein
MKIVRFLIEIDPAWQATITCEAAGPGWSISRALRKLPFKGVAFPFPPSDEMPSPGDLDAVISNDQDLAPLEQMYGRIINRNPLFGPPSDIEIFGRYLFRALIGEAAWQLITAAAKTSNAEYIELALSWDAKESHLHRLNWEMMYGPKGFLAAGLREAGPVVPIGIVRVVHSTPGVPRVLNLPPRLLFVVNSDIADEKIRPAAEIMGMIERLERQSRGFHREVLRNASAKLLSARIKAFEPDVVHFIGHGDVDANQRGFLLFKDEEQKKDVSVYADQILSLIEAAGTTPPIVVLSACKSAGGAQRAFLLGAHATAPLAAELVERGVPIVVGMAGRVSDRACRLFTLGFAVGLLSGEPLLAAIAAGRCASFAQGEPPHKSADWAFPAVFLSAKVPPDYIATTIGANDPAMQLASWLSSLELVSTPVFSAREKFFDAYDALLGRGEEKIRPAVLGIHVAKNIPGFGRKRLLQELAGQALRDGHLPLLLTNERPDGNFAQNALMLAIDLIGAADNACDKLNIPTIKSQVLLIKNGGDIAALRQNLDLDIKVKREFERTGAITDLAVKLALQADLARLAEVFRSIYERPGRTQRVVVLLNRIELFGDALTTSLLSNWADASGFGTPKEPVPLIFTFALGTAADHIFRPWIAEASNRTWLIQRELEPFARGEDMLAYQRVFMNPFKPELLPGVSNVALAFDDEADAKLVQTFEDFFRLTGKGMPGAFLSEETFAIAQSAIKAGYLVKMEDAELFDEIFKRK